MLMIRNVAVAGLLAISLNSTAEELFDFAASTPEGSWATKEIRTTDHRGRETVSVMTQKFLSSENRGGQLHYWLETSIDNYTMRRGEQRPEGEHMVLKVLVEASAMSADPANVMNNLQGFGKEIIMQAGDAEPMAMSGAGSLAGAMMQAMGTKVNYDFSVDGTESVTTQAGTFQARRLRGSGSVETKVMFTRMNVQSESTTWLSEDVPFGVVKGESTDVVNGNEQTSTTTLLQYGTSGATTEITKPVKEMPKLPFDFG